MAILNIQSSSLLSLFIGLSTAQISTVTTSSPSPTATIPAECTHIPPTLAMTDFLFFNSSHNLDCVQRNYPDGSEVCWSRQTDYGALCDPAVETECICTAYCLTGLAPAAYIPLSFGPQDLVNITIEGHDPCTKPFPVGFRDYELGYGHVDCGSAADEIGFYGSSEEAESVGSVYLDAYYDSSVSPCTGYGISRYEGSFPMSCVKDAGGNATCTAPVPVQLNWVGFH